MKVSKVSYVLYNNCSYFHTFSTICLLNFNKFIVNFLTNLSINRVCNLSIEQLKNSWFIYNCVPFTIGTFLVWYLSRTFLFYLRYCAIFPLNQLLWSSVQQNSQSTYTVQNCQMNIAYVPIERPIYELRKVIVQPIRITKQLYYTTV